MFDTIAHFFLIFSNLLFIAPLIILGFIGLDRRFFFELTCLLLLSITCNVALKVTFHIPLSEALGIQGFAFPSGHMQLATVLYGYLFFAQNTQMNNNFAYKKAKIALKIMLSALLVGIGWRLLHCGYHNFFDVAGGIITGLLLIGIYKVTREYRPKITQELVLLLATLAMLYSYLRYPQVPWYAWSAYFTLIGLSVSEKLLKTIRMPITLLQKTSATLIFILLALLIHFSSKNTAIEVYVLPLQWFLLGFLLPASCRTANKVTK